MPIAAQHPANVSFVYPTFCPRPAPLMTHFAAWPPMLTDGRVSASSDLLEYLHPQAQDSDCPSAFPMHLRPNKYTSHYKAMPAILCSSTLLVLCRFLHIFSFFLVKSRGCINTTLLWPWQFRKVYSESSVFIFACVSRYSIACFVFVQPLLDLYLSFLYLCQYLDSEAV